MRELADAVSEKLLRDTNLQRKEGYRNRANYGKAAYDRRGSLDFVKYVLHGDGVPVVEEVA